MRKTKIRPRPLKTLAIILVLILLGLGGKALVLPIIYPVKYLNEIKAAASEFSLDPYLLLAIIKEESRFKPDAVSSAGAEGLMQLMPETGQWILEQMNLDTDLETAIWDPALNIRMGAWYINWLINSYYDGNQVAALAAYNAGMQNVNYWLQDGI